MFCKLCRKMKFTILDEIEIFDESTDVKIIKIRNQNFLLVKRKDKLSRNVEECGKLLLNVAKHICFLIW